MSFATNGAGNVVPDELVETRQSAEPTAEQKLLAYEQALSAALGSWEGPLLAAATLQIRRARGLEQLVGRLRDQLTEHCVQSATMRARLEATHALDGSVVLLPALDVEVTP